jgi:hypothetical protein
MQLYLAKYLVAGDPLTAPKVIDELSRSECVVIRVRVAENAGAALPTLLRLAKDIAPEVRIGLTYNPNLLTFLAHELAWDENPDVRYALAENPHAPIDVLRLLADDENPYVSVRALRTLAKLEVETDKNRNVMAEAA